MFIPCISSIMPFEVDMDGRDFCMHLEGIVLIIAFVTSLSEYTRM